MRKLATIRIISSVNPIEGADKIEYVMMEGLGWKAITSKGEMHVGDKVVFFEIDSALPINDTFAFLADRCFKRFTNFLGEQVDACYRIKTVKLRGVVSQGLVMPVSKFPALWPFQNTNAFADADSSESLGNGDDVSELLGVRHYDEIIEQYATSGVANVTRSTFPTQWCPRTDEERIQNLMNFFNDYPEVEWEATEKVDGSSMTVIYSPTARPQEPFFICSRNQELKFNPDDCWGYVVAKTNVMALLKSLYEQFGTEIALQGELVGPKMNGNRDKFTELKWKIFKIWDINASRYLTPDERQNVCSFLGLEHVKVLRRNWKVFKDLTTLDLMLEYVKGKTDNGNEREGVVFKSHDGLISFKCINNKYLLQD